jgi:P-type E1-E2 ATPase
VIVASGAAARRGILIKDAAALENASRVTKVVLDKTGTLTEGKPALSALLPAEGISEDWLLTVAAAAERLSNHPLAGAIVTADDERNESTTNRDRLIAQSLTVLPGEGIQADSAKGVVFIGKAALLERLGIPSVTVPAAGITLHVALNGKYLGAVILRDQLASGSASAVQTMLAKGLQVLLLTGDTKGNAAPIAAAAGIAEVIADTKPADKWRVIEKLKEEGHVVAMIGDGINDAPALAAADVGIALGTGADIAIEAADVIITQHDLRKAAHVLVYSRQVLTVIWQNLFWALIYNVLLIPLAAGLLAPWGLTLSPTLAAAAMAASSVCVVLNSLRLGYQA